MSLSGCLPSFDVDVVAECEAPTCKVTNSSSFMNYQLTTQEIRDLNGYYGDVLTLDHASCLQVFSVERKVHGKSHVWKAQKLDSSDSKHISSVVQVDFGNTKHVGRVIHFLALPVSGINKEFATIEIFTVFEQDPDSCLYFVNTLSFNVTTVPFEFISVPLVTAIDNDTEFNLWILNI